MKRIVLAALVAATSTAQAGATQIVDLTLQTGASCEELVIAEIRAITGAEQVLGDRKLMLAAAVANLEMVRRNPRNWVHC